MGAVLLVIIYKGLTVRFAASGLPAVLLTDGYLHPESTGRVTCQVFNRSFQGSRAAVSWCCPFCCCTWCVSADCHAAFMQRLSMQFHVLPKCYPLKAHLSSFRPLRFCVLRARDGAWGLIMHVASSDSLSVFARRTAMAFSFVPM